MKKEDFLHFIGIDISKDTFDVAVLSGGETASFVFENTPKGTNAFLRSLRNQKIPLEQCLICTEHTGVYGKLLIAKLVEKNANLCVEMSLRIIRSLGIRRGKSDRIDAVRIAEYARKNVEELEIYEPLPEVLEKVRILLTVRDRLVKSRAALNKYPNELKQFAPELAKIARQNIEKTDCTLTAEIKRIEAEMQALVLADERLNRTVGLATSVPGIGRITALQLTIYTSFFTRYENPRQLACYCGVVPFEHSSGTSILKRARVNSMANKVLKRQLHLCALAAMTHDPQLRDYYRRKVEEGKSKMLVINNVRNKLVHRLCAVIKRQEPYVRIMD